jgi:hypothetical protein
MRGTGHFSGGDRSYIGHNYLPNKFKQVANCNHKMFCGTYSKDGNIFLSASQGVLIAYLVLRNGRFNLFFPLNSQIEFSAYLTHQRADLIAYEKSLPEMLDGVS